MVSCSIIMGHILKDLKQTQKGPDEMRVLRAGSFDCYVSRARSSGAPTHRPLGTINRGSVWLELRNYCLAPLLLYCLLLLYLKHPRKGFP